MKRTLYSLTLGILVFMISFVLLDREPAKEARVLSTSQPILENMEEPASIKLDSEESFQVDYEPATLAVSDQNEGITPSRLVIPSIGVDAPVIPQGYTKTGAMAVPNSTTKVGWFQPGTKPGRRGNAVIAGHVDGRSGPAVFFDLKELQAGDHVLVYGKNGESLTFEVTRVVAYPLNDAPLRELFGPTNERALNLITCTGPYNDEIQEYTQRLAVFTTLAED